MFDFAQDLTRLPACARWLTANRSAVNRERPRMKVASGPAVCSARRHMMMRNAALIIAAIPGAAWWTPAMADNDVAGALDQITRLRNECYELVRDVKVSFRPSDRQYIECRERYEATRAACDTWIDTIRTRLASGSSLNDDAVRQAAREFAADVADLKAYASSALKRGSRGAGELIAAIAPVLVEVAVKIYGAWKSSTADERRSQSDALNSMRFASFSTV